MLLVIDFYKDFVNVESVAVASVLSLQAAGIESTKFDAPETDRLAADSYAPLG